MLHQVYYFLNNKPMLYSLVAPFATDEVQVVSLLVIKQHVLGA